MTLSSYFRYFDRKSTKKFEIFKTFANKSADFVLLFFCSTFAAEMRRIVYCIPIDYMRGNLSGSQVLEYTAQGGAAYDAPDGVKTSALNYQPRMIAARVRRTDLRYFIVRTRSSVNMTAAMRRSMAVMGGAGALYASLLNMKTSNVYRSCVQAWTASTGRKTFRQFMVSRLMAGLAAKDSPIDIDGVVSIDNPWQTSGSTNVPVSQDVKTKFDSILGA